MELTLLCCNVEIVFCGVVVGYPQCLAVLADSLVYPDFHESYFKTGIFIAYGYLEAFPSGVDGIYTEQISVLHANAIKECALSAEVIKY